MKIAVIVPSLRDLAPVQVAIAVAGYLARSGHSVTVYYLKEQFGIQQYEEISFKKFTFFGRFSWRDYDIIHSHGFMPDTFVSLRKPRRSRAKSVTTIHNYVFPELKLLYNQVVSWTVGWSWVAMWKRLDHMVVLTDDALLYYRSLLPKKQLSRIYNGKNIVQDPGVILPQHRLLADEIRRKYNYCIGTISALISRKRIDILVRYLSRVKTGGLLILGEGPERNHLEELVTRHSLQDRVKFLGYIPHAHVYNELFDISAHTSMSEGFSLSLIEASFYQKKIVCSDIPSFREAFTDNEATFFGSDNELTIDHAILEAWQDNEKPKKAFTKAMTCYTEERMGKEYEALFKFLLPPTP
jgi:glycosyltransferase involved in cell wall biosynthesis